MEDTLTSKKLWFCVGAVVLTFIYCVLAATKMPGLKEQLSGFTGLLEFVVGAFLTGSLVNKGVVVAANKLAPKAAVKLPEGAAKASLE
jgi:4-hydroxybenzoate polyprenyltransferase